MRLQLFAEKEGWTCPQCGKSNVPGRITCMSCHSTVPEDYVPPPQRSLSASSIQEGSGESDSVTITTEDNQGRPEVTEIVTEQSLEFVNNTMFRVKSLYLTVDKGIVPGILEGSCDYMRFTPTNTPVIAILGVGCSVSNLGLGVHSAVLVFVLVFVFFCGLFFFVCVFVLSFLFFFFFVFV